MIRDLLLLKTSRRVCCPQAAKTIHSCAPAAQGELAKGQEKAAWAISGGEHNPGSQTDSNRHDDFLGNNLEILQCVHKLPFSCSFTLDSRGCSGIIKRQKRRHIKTFAVIRVWRSLVSRLNGVQEALSSNLSTRTRKKPCNCNGYKAFLFFLERVRNLESAQKSTPL